MEFLCFYCFVFISLIQIEKERLDLIFVLADPWSIETNGGTSVRTASNDPWGSSTASTSKVNPWGGNQQSIATNDNGLSVNLSDPWGLGATSVRPPPPPTSPRATTNTIDNELSDFFGASASKICIE